MIGRKAMGRALPFLLVLLALGFFFAIYNLLTMIIRYKPSPKWIVEYADGILLSDPIVEMPESVR